MEVRLFAWNGDPTQGFYVVPAGKVEEFQRYYGSWGNWVLINVDSPHDPQHLLTTL